MRTALADLKVLRKRPKVPFRVLQDISILLIKCLHFFHLALKGFRLFENFVNEAD